MRLLPCLLFALTLAIPLAQASPSPASDATARTGTVLLVGDSLSSAHRIPAEAGWVNLLQQRVDHRYHDVVVVDVEHVLAAALQRHQPALRRGQRLHRQRRQGQPDV